MSEGPHGPFPTEDFLAYLTEGLKIRGNARAITAVVEGNCLFAFYEMDFGVDFWTLHVAVPVYIFYALSEEERRLTAEVIEEMARPFFTSTSNDDLKSVVITPRVGPATETWREEAIRFVKGEGVTNQGRVRSDNIASQQHRGLLFRSKAKIILYEAMTCAQLAVAPLTVFVRIGKSFNRIDP